MLAPGWNRTFQWVKHGTPGKVGSGETWTMSATEGRARLPQGDVIPIEVKDTHEIYMPMYEQLYVLDEATGHVRVYPMEAIAKTGEAEWEAAPVPEPGMLAPGWNRTFQWVKHGTPGKVGSGETWTMSATEGRARLPQGDVIPIEVKDTHEIYMPVYDQLYVLDEATGRVRVYPMAMKTKRGEAEWEAEPVRGTPSARKVLLLRHGEGHHNRDPKLLHVVDPSLTPTGEEQAHALAADARLADCQLLVVSPLSRAVQTAVRALPWAAAWRADAIHGAGEPRRRVVLTALHSERWSAKCDEGRPKSELAAALPCVCGWEGFPELSEHWTPTRGSDRDWQATRVPRFTAWLDTQPESRIVVVGHGRFFQECLRGQHLKNCEIAELAQCQAEPEGPSRILRVKLHTAALSSVRGCTNCIRSYNTRLYCTGPTVPVLALSPPTAADPHVQWAAASGLHVQPAAPFVIGISGATRCGKGTLTASLKQLLGDAGLRVFTLCGDRYYDDRRMAAVLESGRAKSREAAWEFSESIDFERLYSEAREVASSGDYDVVVLEGFRLFVHAATCDMIHLTLWLEIGRETCRKRREKSKSVSPTTFAQALWPVQPRTLLRRGSVRRALSKRHRPIPGHALYRCG